jgi:outer membrane immunogenic protein
MSIPFAESRPRAHPYVLACYLFAATLPLACGAVSASAADMPVKAAAPATPPYQWTGCYVGLNGGGGATSSNFTTTVDPTGTHLPTPADAAEVANDGTGSANVSNFLGGGQVGCNWQTGMLVVGLEGDFDYFHSNVNFFNNTNVLPSTGDPFTIGQSLKTDYLATVRPRFGIGVDRNFTYITGGAAFTKVNYTESYIDSLNGGTLPGTGMATAAKSLVGWVAGAGWEYALADHWTLKLEYLFAKFGTVKASGLITDAAGGVNALQGSADVTIQVARAGVNLKF